MIRNKLLNSLSFPQKPADAYMAVRLDNSGLGRVTKRKRATHFVLPLMLNIQNL
jgi:hypothetical protein